MCRDSIRRGGPKCPPSAVAGKGTKEIGEKLFISGKTVKNNLSNIFQQTGAKNRVQLMSFVRHFR